MKVSVITPTADREKWLKGSFSLLQQQTYSNWEWLIYDTSFKPTHFSDPRVQYIYDPGVVTIGEKRNRLLEKASGEIIVHFDDDDFYASHYLEMCVERLKSVDFVTFEGWFSYDTKTGQFFYWDTQELGEVRYCLDAISGMRVREIDFGPLLEGQKMGLNKNGKKGYGFSFAYTKKVAKRCRFPNVDFGEDHHFYDEAEKMGFSFATPFEQRGEVFHIIHETNISVEFPQYRIPSFMIQKMAPALFPYLKEIYEN